MRIDFRQGLLAFQKDTGGNPGYLQLSNTGGYVSLIVSPTPTTIVFAHGNADYAVTLDTSKDMAWGPIDPAVETHLYWDIDTLTSKLTYGTTTHKPTVSTIEPERVEGAHWFDLNDTTMKVFQTTSNKWVTRIRVFAGTVQGTLIRPMGSGTQVGLNVPSRPGYIMLDSQLRPLRNSVGEFLTTESAVHIKNTSSDAGVLATAPNAFIPVRAGENLPAMSLVYFSDDDTVSLASSSPMQLGRKTPVGIIQNALATNEVGVLTQTGDITYDQWDWTNHIGKPVYSDANGKITTTRPQGLVAYRVGFIKNKNTIIFGVDSETEAQVYQASPTSMIFESGHGINIEDRVNSIGERIVKVSGVNSIAGVADGLMTKEQAADLERVKSRFGALESQVEGNTTRITRLELSGDDLSRRVEHLETNDRETQIAIAGMRSDVDNIKADTTCVAGIITNHAERIAVNEVKIEANAAHIDALRGTVNVVEGEVAALRTEVQTNTAAVGSIEAKQELIDTHLVNVDASLANHNARITALEAGSGGDPALEARVAAVETGLATTQTKVTDVETGLETTKTRVTAVEDALSAIQTQVTDVSEDLTETKTRVDVVEDGLSASQTQIANLESGKLGKNEEIPVTQVTGLTDELSAIQSEIDALQLDSLGDVDTSGKQAGQVLMFNGTNWVPGEGGGSGGSSTLEGLIDVDVTSKIDGSFLRFDGGTGKWVAVDTIDDVVINGGEF